jgi:hypothetical protein
VGTAPGRGPEPDKAIKSLPRGDPDVEAMTVDAVLALLPPPREAVQQVDLVERILGDERIGATKPAVPRLEDIPL